MSASIRKAWLYDAEAGQVDLDYAEWAEKHIQDLEVAHEIAEGLLSEPGATSDNFDKTGRCFEVYSIIDRERFKAQHDEYVTSTFHQISDEALGALCESNGCPSVGENLAQGQSQQEATAYLVGRAPHYDDSEGHWLQAYIEWLHQRKEA